MFTQRKVQLSPLDKKCLMRFYMHELKLYLENGSEYIKSLGIEGGYEIIENLVRDEPEFMKIICKDIDNFVVLLDEKGHKNYSPLFIMVNGEERQLDYNDDDEE